MARSTCDSRFSRHRISTRCTVEGATPISAASWTGPRRLRSRNDTIRFVTAGHVLAGIVCGRLDRSVIDSPGGVPVGPPLDRRPGALEPGGDLSDRHALVDDQLGDPEPGARSQGSVSVGHEGLLFGEVNLEQFHSTAGGPPMSPRHNDESHSLNQPVRSVQLGRSPPVHEGVQGVVAVTAGKGRVPGRP